MKIFVELDAVATMATFWNIPIIGYMASSNAFADKNIYKTLSRVSLRTTNSLAEAVAALLRHFNWQRVRLGRQCPNCAPRPFVTRFQHSQLPRLSLKSEIVPIVFVFIHMIEQPRILGVSRICS